MEILSQFWGKIYYLFHLENSQSYKTDHFGQSNYNLASKQSFEEWDL